MTARVAYIGTRTTQLRNAHGEGIVVCQIGPDGTDWQPIQIVGGLENPSYLAVDRQHENVYTVHGDGSQVSRLTISAEDGSLTYAESIDCGGTNPVYLTVAPDRSSLYVANYGSGNVGRITLDTDGSLQHLSHVLPLLGAPGPHRVQQPGSRPHQVEFDRSGRRLVVPDKGLDTVFVFDVSDEAAVHPTPLSSCVVRPGSGPRHFAEHPTLPVLYVVNELTCALEVVRTGPDQRDLTPDWIVPAVPPWHVAAVTGSEIIIAPSGRWIYVSARGSDTIARFTIDPVTGRPEEPQWTPTGGSCPRFISADFEHGILHAANERSDEIVFFAIDPDDGTLHPSGRTFAVNNPVCIAFI